MKEKERLIVSGLVVLLLVLWLGFPFHQSPRFAGSLLGGIFGVSGALLMTVPLLYLFIKRIKSLKKRVTQHVSMRTLLAWHIYAGVFGPILVVIHSGHKYESPIGILLIAMTLLVVISGFVGRYLMKQFAVEIREKQALLATLQSSYQQAATEISSMPELAQALQQRTGFVARLFTSFLSTESLPDQTDAMTSPSNFTRLSEAIADVEYAIKTHELFKTWFGTWLKFHIAISMILYILMALHIWAAIHFGLRWFE